MEIKKNLTICPEGHYYDAAAHSSCPHCASFSGTQKVGSTQGGAFPKTTDPSNPHNNFDPTMKPTDNDRFNPTVIGDYDIDSSPVVGWLVCIDGPLKGSDFRMHAGYNYIGREFGDIIIRDDRQISRENHAMVAFDSSDLTYFFGPASGRNLVKVNGKTVFNAVELKSYDVISIGTSKLMFVALCGEHFNWETRND